MQDSLIQSLQSETEVIEMRGVKQLRRAPALDPQLAARVLKLQNLGVADRVMLKSALIADGITAAPAQERSEYEWRFRVIYERLQEQVPMQRWTPRTEWAVQLTPELLRMLQVLRTPVPSESYIADCEAHDVPIAPVWPGEDEEWSNVGVLPFEFNFLGSGPDTEVWIHEPADGKGTCYILPRKTGNTVDLAGIICQSKRTGKACFWDNIDAATGRRISGENITLNVANLKNGYALAENCTNCHRGRNAFIVHPNTVLADSVNRHPAVRYEPIGQPAFVNPPAMSNPGDGPCASCHEIGAPSVGYCGILAMAADKTMPSATLPVTWATPRAPYAAHINYFQTQCRL